VITGQELATLRNTVMIFRYSGVPLSPENEERVRRMDAVVKRETEAWSRRQVLQIRAAGVNICTLADWCISRDPDGFFQLTWISVAIETLALEELQWLK